MRVAEQEAVLAGVADNPHTSVRKLASDVGTSKSTVHRILKENNYHPFKLQKVQDLKPEDPSRRLAFCEWLLQKHEINNNFSGLILACDEKGFSRGGTFNANNNHHWSVDNPHATFIRGYQDKFSVNVWAGILGNHLICPYILPHRLNGANYLVFLR